MDAGEIAENLPPALDVRGVSKSFGRTQALDRVDLTLRWATSLAFLGSNGSGKSTLIKALAGYHQIDEGSVSIRGHELDVARMGEQGKAAGLRFVHQDLGLIPDLTVADNFALARGYVRDSVGTIRWRTECETVSAHLENFGLRVDPRIEVRRLGPVERTLIAIARAVDEVDPSTNVLILDEPTARLPDEEATRLIASLQALRARGLPIIYVTHRLEEVHRVADVVTVLRDGRVVFAGSVVDVSLDDLGFLIAGAQRTAPISGSTASSAPSTLGQGGPALEMRGVHSRRLRDINLEVRAGEVVGVTGLIGSGRSELGRVAYGTQPFTEGTVAICGRRSFPRSGGVESGWVGYAPQDRRVGLLAGLTVEENLTITSHRGLTGWYGLSRRRLKAAASEVINGLRIRPADPSAMIEQLSGGNQQKVALGKWTRLPLKLLVMDEPTQSIDVGAKSELMGSMRQSAREQGLAVLWIESDIDEVIKYADRILVMRSGRIAKEFDSPPFSKEATLLAAYGDAGAEQDPALANGDGRGKRA